MGKRTSTMPFGVEKGKHGQRKSPSLMAVKRKSGKNMMRNVVLQGLRHLRAPSVVALLASLVFSCGGLDWSPIDHFETFAGDQSITKGEIGAGRTAVPFELNLDPASQDILTDQGFANAIYQTLRLRIGAGSLHAPVCSTWIFMSMGSTLRTRGSPLGRRDSEKVCAGNVMTARVMILCLLASAKACWWLLEQPRSSLMEFHPTFQRLLKLLEVRRLHFDMANFGGPSKKPTVLYSSHSEIDDLLEERRPPLQLADSDRPQMTVKYVDGSGKARCKGGADLRMSQAYPRQFGKAVAKVRTRNQKRIRNAACRFLRASFKTEYVLDRSKTTHAHWMKHAILASVLHFLASKQLGAD